jgi:hypothetical protein
VKLLAERPPPDTPRISARPSRARSTAVLIRTSITTGSATKRTAARRCPARSRAAPPTRTRARGNTSEIVLPTATSVSAGSASLRRTGRALTLSGVPFNGAPSQSVITPRRLTIWLPPGVKVTGAPAKPCTQAFAASMTLDNWRRCAKILGGRLGGNGDITAWFAWAGPKQGAKQRLWLRGRSGDDLVGFGTGWIESVKGAYPTKITLELGTGITTRGLEVLSDAERATVGMVRPLTDRCSAASACAWTPPRAARRSGSAAEARCASVPARSDEAGIGASRRCRGRPGRLRDKPGGRRLRRAHHRRSRAEAVTACRPPWPPCCRAPECRTTPHAPPRPAHRRHARRSGG